MAELRGSNAISTESRDEFNELGHVTRSMDYKAKMATRKPKKRTTPRIDAVVKKEDEDNEDLLSSPFVIRVDHELVLKQSPNSETPLGVTSKVSNGEALEKSTEDIGMADAVDAPADTVNTNTLNDFADDDLNHIVLKERWMLLLLRRCLELEKKVIEGTCAGFSEDLIDLFGGKIKDTQSAHEESSAIGGKYNEIPERKASNLGMSSVNASSETIFAANQYSEIPGKSVVPEAPNSRIFFGNAVTMCSYERASDEFNSLDGQCDVQPGSSSMHLPSLQTSVKVKVEPMKVVS